MASPPVRKGPLVGDAPRRTDTPPLKDGALESMEPSVAAGPAQVDYSDLQGLVRFGHGKMSEAASSCSRSPTATPPAAGC